MLDRWAEEIKTHHWRGKQWGCLPPLPWCLYIVELNFWLSCYLVISYCWGDGLVISGVLFADWVSQTSACQSTWILSSTSTISFVGLDGVASLLKSWVFLSSKRCLQNCERYWYWPLCYWPWGFKSSRIVKLLWPCLILGENINYYKEEILHWQ
jgi:hypothetical protein